MNDIVSYSWSETIDLDPFQDENNGKYIYTDSIDLKIIRSKYTFGEFSDGKMINILPFKKKIINNEIKHIPLFPENPNITNMNTCKEVCKTHDNKNISEYQIGDYIEKSEQRIKDLTKEVDRVKNFIDILKNISYKNINIKSGKNRNKHTHYESTPFVKGKKGNCSITTLGNMVDNNKEYYEKITFFGKVDWKDSGFGNDWNIEIWKKYKNDQLKSIKKEKKRRKKGNQKGIPKKSNTTHIKKVHNILIANCYILKNIIDNLIIYVNYLGICITNLNKYKFTVHEDFCYNNLVVDMIKHIDFLTYDVNLDIPELDKYMEKSDYKDDKRYKFSEIFIIKNKPKKIFSYVRSEDKYYTGSEYVYICKSNDKKGEWNIFFSNDQTHLSSFEEVLKTIQYSMYSEILEKTVIKYDHCDCKSNEMCYDCHKNIEYKKCQSEIKKLRIELDSSLKDILQSHK